MIKETKKALSHVEMMVSFTIFLIFVLLLLNFFNPFERQSDDAGLNLAEGRIMSSLQETIITSNIIVEDIPAGVDCFRIEKVDSANLVARKDDERINASNSANGGIENLGNGIYQLFYSDSFQEMPNAAACSQVERNINYKFGATVQKKIIFIKRLKDLELLYSSDYTNAKKSLGIPVTIDFEFSVHEPNGGEIARAMRNEPSGVNIESKNIQIEVIDENASIRNVILNLRTW